MADTASVNLRIDKELKKQAEELFSELGINMTTAINMFLKQSVREHAIPFRVGASSLMFEHIPAYKGDAGLYDDYREYVDAKLNEASKKISDGTVKYYTAEEVRKGLEELLNEKI